ncbi:3370_t:CDS:1, partial [Acaulospora colombiana]
VEKSSESLTEGFTSTASESRKEQRKLLESMIAENSFFDYENTLSLCGNNALGEGLNDSKITNNNINKDDTPCNLAATSQPSVPPGFSQNPMDLQRHPTANSQYNTFNLDDLNRSDLISIIQNLSNEKSQLISSLISLQHELQSMNMRYAKLIEMTRDRELQTIQMLETRKQQEMEEKMRYIQKLELRISQLESQNQTSSISESINQINNSSPGSPNTQLPYGPIIFPTTLHPGSSSIGSSKYTNPWRSNSANRNSNRSTNNLRCGNCGDQGHISQECNNGCRYCNSFEHLSESCNQSGFDDNSVQVKVNEGSIDEISPSNNGTVDDPNEPK